MSSLATPHRDPVTEVFDAVAQARRSAPGGGGDWKVGVRSRTGQLLATFTLGSYAQVLSFADRVAPLGYHMAPNEWEGAGCYDFCFDRRAANESLDPPRRRRGE